MFNTKTKYAVLGLARSGIAAAYKIKEMGGTAFLSDVQPMDKINNAEELLCDFECEFGRHTDRLLNCDQWIVSPGIPLSSPIIQKGLEQNIKLISEIEFGFQIKAGDSKIIAVTGSNGKSTTASLIHHILKNTGYNSILAGNIGSAFCSHPIQILGLDFIVLEVSSFQLDLIETFRPDVSVLLNITPDHLNRYESFEHYVCSKFRIFENQTLENTAVICIDSEPVSVNQNKIKASIKRYSLFQTPPYCDAWLNKDTIQVGIRYKLPVSDLKIKGSHNHANTMAAILSVDALTHDIGFALEAARSFEPLTHRLEYVATINGVLFYNDSKATNTDSVKSALTSFEKPIRVIMGGSDKGEDFSQITSLLLKWAQKVYITGNTMEKMRSAWQDHMPTCCIDDFETCLRTAFREATAGDIVVLSPACASFDKFNNFEHRGEVFKEIIQRIKKENEKK